MTISGWAISGAAISALSGSVAVESAPVTSAALPTGDDFYTADYADRFITAHVDIYDTVTGGAVTHYIASKPYTTLPSDSPANTRFAGVVADPDALAFSREISVGDVIGGRTQPDRGALTIINGNDPDGQTPDYDSWFNTERYAFDGRNVTIYGLLEGEAYTSRRTLMTGTVDGLDTGANTVTLRLRGYLESLNRPIQTNTYTGLGGVEGGTEIAGQTKPLCLGRLFNAPLVLVDYANLVYQVHDGITQEIEAVRDEGVALTAGADQVDYAALVAATVTNDYDTCINLGLIRLASEPAGVVTADVKGSTLGGTYSASAAKLIEYIAGTIGGVTLDEDSISALHTANSAETGYYCGTQSVNMLDALDAIAGTVGAWYGFNRTGSFEVGRLEAPPATASTTITEKDIVRGSLQRQETGRVVNKTRVQYKPNWTVQSTFAGAVTADDRQEYSQQYRAVDTEDIDAQARHLLSVQRTYSGLFYSQSDALLEAVRLQTLLGTQRVLWSMELLRYNGQFALGEAVKLQHPRYGLENGKIMRVVAMTENLLSGRTLLVLWG